VKVYAGTDPLTGREIRFRKTCKTERAAQSAHHIVRALRMGLAKA